MEIPIFDQVKRWVGNYYFAKRDHASTSRGAADGYRPVILNADGVLDISLYNFSGLPTSSAGLTTGQPWNDSGTLKIKA